MNLRPMEHLLLRVIVIGVLVLATLLGFAYFAKHHTKAEEQSAQAFIREKVLPIARQWQAPALLQIASPGFAQLNPEPQLAKRLAAYGSQGALVETRTIEVLVDKPFFGSNEKGIQAMVNIPSVFERGQANVRLTLVQLSGQWRVETITLQ
jgi:hypothetical protein